MKVTFLGTGTSQGVPVIGCACEVCRSLDFRDKRLRTSIHIEIGDSSIIFDSGPDFRQQILRENITCLDALVFTHEHKDHTAGMDDIRSFNFLQKKDIPVYARKNVIEQLKREFAYIFNEAIALAKEMNADKTYFTHLSHKMGTHKKTEKLLPENIEIAYDGLKIEI